jgi:phosphomevalonate kinase
LQFDQVPLSASLFAHAANALTRPLPDGLDIILDTTDFHRQEEKLGIGSSAAALVTCYGAMCALTGEDPCLDRAIAAHRAFQGSGSGLDVAAAMTGGVIRFQSGQVQSLDLPDDLHFAFVFSGRGIATGKQLGSFSQWRQRGNTQALQDLADAATGLFDAVANKRHWEIYVEALQQLDNAAKLGIYNDAHRQLAQLSESLGLVYKPCGAGGGDVGMAVGFDPDDHALLRQFIELCIANDFMPLDLTGTPHGLHVEQ